MFPISQALVAIREDREEFDIFDVSSWPERTMLCMTYRFVNVKTNKSSRERLIFFVEEEDFTKWKDFLIYIFNKGDVKFMGELYHRDDAPKYLRISS